MTAGYVNDEPRREFFQHIDAANVDLKAFSDRFYHDLCAARLVPVLETLRYLVHETGVWVEITTLLIPGENDSDEEVRELVSWVLAELGPDVPLHFTAFHPDWKMRDRPRTPARTLSRARRTALDIGLRHVYTGNVYDPEGQSTRCHACRQVLVGRDGYRLTAWGLGPGATCTGCGASCAGVFEAEPGDWGGRRLPVRIGRGR